MDLSDIHIKIENDFFQGTMLSLITTLDDSFNNLVEEDKAILFKWLEFEFLYEQITIYDTMQISWSLMKEQLSSDANQELETISKTKKRNIEYLERWIIDNKSNNLKVEELEIDLSETTTSEKIIYLYKTGVLGFLVKMEPFNTSTNKLASLLSAITGENHSTIQSAINPIINKDSGQKNNPLNTEKTVSIVEHQLIKLGCNLNKLI